jgi:uncharacterized protein (TIGR02448 family)
MNKRIVGTARNSWRPPSILNDVVLPLRFTLSEDTLMRRLFIISSLVLCLPFGSAFAKVDAGDVATSAGVSASLYSTFKDDKLMIPARDDASSFVASGGTIRGVYLESVMQQIRKDNPGLNASDEDLARAILIQDGAAAGQ